MWNPNRVLWPAQDCPLVNCAYTLIFSEQWIYICDCRYGTNTAFCSLIRLCYLLWKRRLGTYYLFSSDLWYFKELSFNEYYFKKDLVGICLHTHQHYSSHGAAKLVPQILQTNSPGLWFQHKRHSAQQYRPIFTPNFHKHTISPFKTPSPPLYFLNRPSSTLNPTSKKTHRIVRSGVLKKC